jgi:hypothetical protein
MHANVFRPEAVVAQFLATFQEFPPRQKPASFSVDQALEGVQPSEIKEASSCRFACSRS